MTLGLGKFLVQDRLSGPEFTELPVEGLLGTWNIRNSRSKALSVLGIDGIHGRSAL